jgi:hypothetical protein
MMKSEIRGIELVARMVSQTDVGDESSRLPTLPEAVDKQHVECGIMLTQLSQETQADTDVEETPFVASNKTMLNVEPVCRSVGVANAAAADMRFILGVDPRPIATGFTLDVDSFFIELEFMLEYAVTFGDERAEDSADDRPVPELSKSDKALLQ